MADRSPTDKSFLKPTESDDVDDDWTPICTNLGGERAKEAKQLASLDVPMIDEKDGMDMDNLPGQSPVAYSKELGDKLASSGIGSGGKVPLTAENSAALLKYFKQKESAEAEKKLQEKQKQDRIRVAATDIDYLERELCLSRDEAESELRKENGDLRSTVKMLVLHLPETSIGGKSAANA
eukprot:GHVQ01000234.1.p1 GENE.GHVQ01000234.1~~GHVQ01000234.1.p1  ORF type:complete len:180 (+),score=36.19 GHVQ01000234.1:266-805(+)